MSQARPLVVITGASSGIGAATAQAFGGRGYPTLLLARRAELIEELGVPDSIARSVDVTDRDALAAALDEATQRYGAPDLLVNNAGVMPLSRVVDQDPEEWRTLFDVNCLALLTATQLVLPGMVAAGRGTVVNISSIAGRNVYANHAVYSGTKFAVNAMTETMRREHADDGVRFSLVSPGIVDTDLLVSVSDAAIKESYEATKTRLRGGLDAATIAETIVGLYELPQDVCVREVVVAPTSQAS
ncbi:SDR family oxidoreductase [Nocardioides lijunqiniae]|uniref:SDR family oxidoreductase n=1 Tax=Nocardioides lijunqiniae TaxID=2760832 RepID=UPI00187805C1|nr:SDR family oxidoreductase [Nocardioides lijunqiniae]